MRTLFVLAMIVTAGCRVKLNEQDVSDTDCSGCTTDTDTDADADTDTDTDTDTDADADTDTDPVDTAEECEITLRQCDEWTGAPEFGLSDNGEDAGVEVWSGSGEACWLFAASSDCGDIESTYGSLEAYVASVSPGSTLRGSCYSICW
ncbi:MAG: hypothetical protein WC752_03325 [Patescibacteria group bacterium]|jgi:hypothetical protein